MDTWVSAAELLGLGRLIPKVEELMRGKNRLGDAEFETRLDDYEIQHETSRFGMAAY